MIEIIYTISPLLSFWLTYVLTMPLFSSRLIKPNVDFTVPTAPNAVQYIGFNFIVSILLSFLVFPNVYDPPKISGIELWKFIPCSIIADLWFYTSHRLMHCKYLYPYHSIHHRVKYTKAYACVYCHWLEMVLGNIPTVILGPYLTNMNYLTLHLWLSFGCLNTMYGHSGGRFFFMPEGANQYHWTHHIKVTGNYAMSRFLDGIFGTLS